MRRKALQSNSMRGREKKGNVFTLSIQLLLTGEKEDFPLGGRRMRKSPHKKKEKH